MGKTEPTAYICSGCGLRDCVIRSNQGANSEPVVCPWDKIGQTWNVHAEHEGTPVYLNDKALRTLRIVLSEGPIHNGMTATKRFRAIRDGILNRDEICPPKKPKREELILDDKPITITLRGVSDYEAHNTNHGAGFTWAGREWSLSGEDFVPRSRQSQLHDHITVVGPAAHQFIDHADKICE